MKLLVAMVLTVFSLNAMADAESNFYEKIHKALASGSEPVELNLKELTAKQQTELLKAAQEEARVWYDTILEGDYVLDPTGQVDLVSVAKVLTSKGQFVGYRIGFAHAAFDTANCEVEWESDSYEDGPYREYLVENCTAGHISSAAYVNPDFTIHFRDEDSIEDFQD